jgi:peptide-methionine (S)-S-oxide reductase
MSTPSNPAPHTPNTALATAQATFGGGCFWCIETVFNQLRGVILAESGYCNGEHPNPSYEAVCSGRTGHAEVVRVTYDPAQVSFGQLMEVFFTIHDPTTLNRQGNDVGTQYRSGIYTHDSTQAHEARALIESLNQAQVYGQPIVTEVEPVRNYHPAEAYHQRYFEQNPHQGYCAFVVSPKVDKFRRTFAELLKKE